MAAEGRRKDGLVGLVAALVVAAVLFLLLLEVESDVIPILRLRDWLGVWGNLARNAFVALIVIVLAWAILRAAGKAFERIAVAKGGSHAHARSVWKVFAYVVWSVIFVILVLSLLGDITIAVFSVGLLGAALAFALQKPLLNVAGWATITYHRIYQIGHRIAVGDVRGYVTDIRVMHTELREFGGWMHGDTFSGRLVVLPNAAVFDGPVYNYTRDIPFVWDEVENLVTYESDVDGAKAHMLAAAKEVVGGIMEAGYRQYLERIEIRDLEGLMLRQPEIRMAFDNSGVRLFVLYFCPAERRRRIKSEITERIWRRFIQDPKVEIAYPHMEVVRYEGKHSRPADEGPAVRKS